MTNKKVQLVNRTPQLLRSRLWMLVVLLVASLLLSGCVHADLGIDFHGQSGGNIVQHIKLADSLTTVNGATTQQWFDKIRRRAQQLQGKAQQSNQEITVSIPFGDGAELADKLNQFLNTPEFQTTTNPSSQTPLIQSHLRVTQQNFLLLFRNRLVYDLDLRALGVQSGETNLLLSPDPFLELEFSLSAPWGARNVSSLSSQNGGMSPEVHATQHQLTWQLQAGELNHLEAVFWFPSSVGLGTVVITLFVAGGITLKYGSSSRPSSPAIANR